MRVSTVLDSINENWSISREELEFLVWNQLYIYEIMTQSRKWDGLFKQLFEWLVQKEWWRVEHRNSEDDAVLSKWIRFSIKTYWLERIHDSRKIQIGRPSSILIDTPHIPDVQSVFGNPHKAVSELHDLIIESQRIPWERWVLLLLGGDSCIGKWETTDRLINGLNDKKNNSAFAVSLWKTFRAIRRRIIMDWKLNNVDADDIAVKLKTIVMDSSYMSTLANELNYIEDWKLDGKDVTRQWDDLNLDVSTIPDHLLPIISEYSQHIAIQAARRYINTKLSKGMDVVVEWRDATLDFFEDGHEKTLRRRLVVDSSEAPKFATARAIVNLFRLHQNSLGYKVTCKEICDILSN